ncbi:MAG: bifunctional nuclease family protein [Eggerthellaceae bacterium]|nr:bifunctional nuclease family protein [Eggerthellaceae bacterium]
MVPLRILTLIFTGPMNPAVLVLEPIEEMKDGCSRVLPIWIGSNEAMQLGVAIEHAKTPRPMTHDLFIDALTNLDACVDHVLIDDAKGSTYFAKLVLRQGGRLVPLDARPTDALSLALRQDAPFMATEDVLDRASFPYIFNEPTNRDQELAEFHSFVNALSPEDFTS